MECHQTISSCLLLNQLPRLPYRHHPQPEDDLSRSHDVWRGQMLLIRLAHHLLRLCDKRDWTLPRWRTPRIDEWSRDERNTWLPAGPADKVQTQGDYWYRVLQPNRLGYTRPLNGSRPGSPSRGHRHCRLGLICWQLLAKPPDWGLGHLARLL